MISLGVFLVILGVGSLVLPSLGLQFTFMDWLDAYQPWAGIIVAAVGLITVLFGAQRRGRSAGAPAAVATTQAAPPAEASAPPQADSAAQQSVPQASAPTQASPPAEKSWPTEPPERSDEA
jgi:predicted lipid-binding transport protein (Tim44 family)